MQTMRKLRPNETALLQIFILSHALVAIIYAQKNIGLGAAIGIWGSLVFINAPISLAMTCGTAPVFAAIMKIFPLCCSTMTAALQPIFP